ncbi:TIGR04283 family arsenosugar biosynthesis glycosyltransferase [bacterium]|nr:TIGR04283 family arsenosugar biosynthesis glycosyltransferase [candidate division CSSED10-310 bacterium]
MGRPDMNPARMPEFSIIMPVLDEEAGIVDAVRAALDPAVGTGAELIVVDGAEGCGTLEMLRKEGIIGGIVSGPPEDTGYAGGKAIMPVTGVRGMRGRAAQMNLGVRWARGEYLAFLHADTRLPARALGYMSEALNAGHAAGAFLQGVTGGGPALRLIAWGANLRTRLLRLPYGDQVFFTTREYFATIGGFAELPLMEDMEFVHRIRHCGDSLVILPQLAMTSSRRWDREGVLFTTARNWLLASLYCLGVSPRRLEPYFRHGRKLYGPRGESDGGGGG